MKARRAILLVMDSFGIGAGPDAYKFQSGGVPDSGSDTLGHIAAAFLDGSAIKPARSLRLPNLQALGLGESYRISRGKPPAGWSQCEVTGHFACAESISTGKDTPSGHWEIAGVPVRFDWTYFPKVPDCFPSSLLDEIFCRSGVSSSLGNRHASGTEILYELGAEHIRTGLPIFYTSADSVFQIACHEESFGLERLLALCQTVRTILDETNLKIGRVIARPFTGPASGPFQRTGNRHDYAVPPPGPDSSSTRRRRRQGLHRHRKNRGHLRPQRHHGGGPRFRPRRALERNPRRARPLRRRGGGDDKLRGFRRRLRAPPRHHRLRPRT